MNKQDNEKVAKEIKEMGGKAFAYTCNLRDKNDIQKTASQVVADVGEPTMLVNNAGIVAGKNLMDLSDNDIQASFDVNILAHFWVSQKLAKIIKLNAVYPDEDLYYGLKYWFFLLDVFKYIFGFSFVVWHCFFLTL